MSAAIAGWRMSPRAGPPAGALLYPHAPGSARMMFRVLLDDNYHYLDESARTTLGEFDTLEAAVAAARAMVDEFPAGSLRPDMAAEELFGAYTSFGEDPFIVGPDL